MLEHLFHINLWRLSFQSKYGAERVLWGSVTVIGRDGLVSHLRSSLGQFKWLLGDAHVGLVPVLGELITVIDQALSAVNDDFVTTKQVRWAIVLLLFQ